MRRLIALPLIVFAIATTATPAEATTLSFEAIDTTWPSLERGVRNTVIALGRMHSSGEPGDRLTRVTVRLRTSVASLPQVFDRVAIRLNHREIGSTTAIPDLGVSVVTDFDIPVDGPLVHGVDHQIALVADVRSDAPTGVVLASGIMWVATSHDANPFAQGLAIRGVRKWLEVPPMDTYGIHAVQPGAESIVPGERATVATLIATFSRFYASEPRFQELLVACTGTLDPADVEMAELVWVDGATETVIAEAVPDALGMLRFSQPYGSAQTTFPTFGTVMLEVRCRVRADMAGYETLGMEPGYLQIRGESSQPRKHQRQYFDAPPGDVLGDGLVVDTRVTGGPVDGTVARGTPHVPMLAAEARGHNLSGTLTSLTVESTRGLFGEVQRIRAWIDVDRDGTGDTLLGEGAYQGNGEALIPITLPLLDGEWVPLLLTADFSPAAREQAAFAFRLTGATGSANTAVRAGDSRLVTIVTLVAPRAVLTLIDPADGPHTARPGADGHLLAVLELVGVGGSLAVDRLDVRASAGSLRNAAAARIRLVHDANGNDRVDGLGEPGGDRELANAAFPGRSAATRLSLDRLALADGGRTRLLLLLDVLPEAPLGAAFALDLTGLRARAGGADTAVTIDGLPLTTPTLHVGEGPVADPEFDPAPLGDFAIGATAGCSAGVGGSAAPLLLALAGLAVLGGRRYLADVVREVFGEVDGTARR